tara:strand:- start:932 stop:1111 length:180 start_codon:yes stop_codon:yes gene_type:complete
MFSAWTLPMVVKDKRVAAPRVTFLILGLFISLFLRGERVDFHLESVAAFKKVFFATLRD